MTTDADADEAVETEGEPADSETTDEAAFDGESTDSEAAGTGSASQTDLNNGYDDTVPNVELGLYQLSVRVSGRSEDDLQSVEDSAKRLMDYLIDRAEELEERPDDRGLS
ncbi:hypothetical protein GL213_08015 [Halogeometricum borinquense]|uniref:Uncharacterized protein n=2 Tax=Halogeometricum borinquense TaxID=60847 RepID=E4NL25_HALBP|nr:hypothetical protein [Halogeometricum borinquense]ADQ67177.1 hypothetical protein Hbor_16070 [Halogeometricum borinquense DSM 11551]ELY29725.1 hypothetical protein C499_05458 [Halogeometricum borinquense DSM 11551]QIB74583.1 hypothetical protein G3I44_09975 [Halogeometricum borinquense]QIQ76470.1 hypothetical protein GL213_08015 [Halogeometricum borinquense]RYJ13865.1 hypothetical protein ELS19_07725 [Halogeometricum borinquense]